MSIIKHRHINRTSKVKKKVIKNKSLKPINKISRYGSKNIADTIIGRYKFIAVFLIFISIIIGIRLFKLQIIEYDYYNKLLSSREDKLVEGDSAPRGRIYDRNYKLLVDNVGVKTIYYKKQDGITKEKEVELAYTLGNVLEVNFSKLSDYYLKDFYCVNNKKTCDSKITDKERMQYVKRKLTDSDIKNLIFERIDEEIGKYEDKDKEAAYIYYLMNKGYSYAEKVIKNKNVTEEEYAIISENIDSLNGVNTKLDWERTYLYGDTFKSILGTVSSDTQGIPKELASLYLEKGYSLADRVGTSYIEYEYEDYLKGVKPIYRINNDNSYELVKEGKRGNDIVLTIDIELQRKLEKVLSNEVLKAKKEANTKYYDHSFVVIADPNTGEILAMSGKQAKYNSKGELVVVDYTPGVVTLPVTPGSIVKGASMMVGYKYGAIDIGSVIRDECIKIKNTPLKCSWKTMGNIDDVYALRYSSNVYQYKVAIRVGKGNYKYDKALVIDESAFDKYRDMYASFGLGVKTGIDLPVESLGYMGTSKLPGHLMDFAIGQYDTYTPIQLSQYISTIANGGTRYKPYLLKEVYSPSVNNQKLGDLIYATETEVLGHVDIDKKYMDRVRYGFREVVRSGLGYGYMGRYSNSSGKTGTSQSFIDTDGDGVVDTETVTTSFVGYSPSENPKMSIVVVSPDIGLPNASYTSAITKRISSQMVNIYFE